MSSKNPQNKGYLLDSLYKQMISAYQKGEWKESGKRLTKLMKKYPGEEELESLAKSISLRKHIDSDAALEAKQAKKKSYRRIAYISLAVAIVIAVSASAYEEYSTQLQQQIEEINLERSLASKFQDAQKFLQAGRPVEAIGLISEISSIDASYPQLDEAIAQAEYLLELENKYDLAAGKYEEGDYSGALKTLTEIFDVEPNFRDVEIQINSLELRKNLSSELLAVAEEAYFKADWSSAILHYESAIENDPSVIDAEIQNRLFASYIGESKNILEKASPNLNEVSLAEDFLRKAQVVLPQIDDDMSSDIDFIEETIVQNYSRIAQDLLSVEADSVDNMDEVIAILGRSLLIDPDDQSIRLQYDLARNFVLGLESYNKDLLEEAIENLDFVYSNSEEYGSGTAKQLLYEAHSKLGWQWFDEGELNNALDEFVFAESVVLGDPSASFRSYEASINIAHVLGELELFVEGSNAYFTTVLVSGIKNSTSSEDLAALNLIFEAEISAFNGDFVASYEQYAEAFAEGYVNFEALDYIIQKGDYLAQIARRFRSTISAIKMNNTISESSGIFVGQRLSIPVLRDE